MLARLKRETVASHRAADDDRMSIMVAAATPATYLAFLSRIYGFEAPVESALAMASGLDEWLDVRGRTQIKLLRADLAALGVLDPAKLPRCTSVAPFRNAAFALLGWLYVVERNTLLHGVIERHLRSRLPRELQLAGSYLASRERSAGARWRELGDAMDRVAKAPRIADHIVAAARAAFRGQHGWYQLAIPRREHVA